MKVHSPHLGAPHPPVQPLHAVAGVKIYLTGLLWKSLATPNFVITAHSSSAAAEKRYRELFYVRVYQLISSMAAAVGAEGGSEETM